MAVRAIVCGLLRDGLGLGEAARGYADALVAAGFDVRQHVIALPGRPVVGDPGPAGLLDLPEVGADAEADVVLVCLNPPEVAVLRDQGIALPQGRALIGFWAWEVDPVPDSWAATDRFDELWVSSRYVADLLAARVDIPVAAIPNAVRLDRASPAAAEPAGPSGGRPTRFLALADGASTFARKNPLGAVEAFRRAFPEPAPAGSGPTLLVKVWNAEHDPGGFAAVREAAAGRPDIEVVDRWLPRDELAALVRSSLALVSLHRAEGLGLPIFEALLAGVPVVATDYSAPRDWLTPTQAFLVAATPATVPEDVHPYPAGSTWAEPDLDHAAAQLRAVWDDPDGARARAARGRELVESHLTPEAVGRAARHRIEALLRGGEPDQRPAPVLRSLFRPPVQVVVAAAEPWPALAPFLRAVEPEVEAVGAELVVGARDPSVLPDAERPRWVQRHDVGSTNPFELRAAALAATDAELVVVTEDHCRPAPGWLAAYRQAALEAPDAVLAGPVTNGSTATTPDWANYLLGFAAWAPPLELVPTDRAPTIANCAVRGELLREKAPAPLPPAWFERDLVVDLWRAGRTELVPTAAVAHAQPFPGWHHLRNHFDDARTAGAHAAAEPGADRPSFRPRELLAVSRLFLRGVTAAVTPRPDLVDRHREAQWWLRALAGARAVGLAVGARFGPGRSGDRLD